MLKPEKDGTERSRSDHKAAKEKPDHKECELNDATVREFCKRYRRLWPGNDRGGRSKRGLGRLTTWSAAAVRTSLLDNGRDHHLPPPRPKVRSSTTSIRLEADVIKRLKALARKKGTGYQTLLKQFVGERLYEEEKREGLLEVSGKYRVERRKGETKSLYAPTSPLLPNLCRYKPYPRAGAQLGGAAQVARVQDGGFGVAAQRAAVVEEENRHPARRDLHGP